jgi:hypothetical protein
MKASTISEIKQELTDTPTPKLIELCLRFAKYKKENKELLTYLLFEAHDTAAYIETVKNEMAEQFKSINQSNVYFVKKTLRKILRSAGKYIRYSGLPTVEIELLIYFCKLMQGLTVSITGNQILFNIYQNRVKKINKTISDLHEDLQYDYLKMMKELEMEFSL